MSDFAGPVRRLVAVTLALTAWLAAPGGATAAELFGVVTSGGRGQPGVAVELFSGDRPVGAVETGHQGTYRFRDIPPGSYRVRAAGEERTVGVGPGINRLDFAK